MLIPRLAEHEFAHASLCGRIALAHEGCKLVALEECSIKRNASRGVGGVQLKIRDYLSAAAVTGKENE